jgi:hypothetical protein
MKVTCCRRRSTTTLTKRSATPRNPPKVDNALGNIVTAIRASGPRLGLPPEMVNDKVSHAVSAVVGGVITSLVDQGQQSAAQIYYDKTKG